MATIAMAGRGGRLLCSALLSVALTAACGGSSVRHVEGYGTAGAPASAAGMGSGVAGLGAGSGGAGSGGAGSDGASVSASGGLAGDETPGCGTTPLDQCDPGPDRLCTPDVCELETGPIFFDERGDGAVCKFESDEHGPDFACLTGEWCEYDRHECRCGRHEGCQLGESCEPCEGPGCEMDAYVCQRARACTADNLDACGAEPGQTCKDGALSCALPEACPAAPDDPNLSRCDGAPGGCCPAGNWCFDGRECRCGASPTCTGAQTCVLDAIGFFACCSAGTYCYLRVPTM